MTRRRLVFPAIVISVLILLVGAGVTAGLIAANDQAPSTPPPQTAASLAEPEPATAPAETVRPAQPIPAVERSGVNPPDPEPGDGVTAMPDVSSNGGGDQFPIPEKAELKYPNLGSALDQMVAGVEEGEVSAREAAGNAPVHQEESLAVTIYLSGNVDEVASFLEENGGSPRNVGEDYIEAYVPVTLLGQVSEQPGVLRVREIIPPQPAG